MSMPDQSSLDDSIGRLGFYPELVKEVVADGLMGREADAHLVHLETHFDNAEFHRHITVLALTGRYLMVAHLDDQQMDEHGETVVAHANVETLPVERITSLTLSYSYPQPAEFTPGTAASEVSLMISWTGGQRIDVQPADCPDPVCTADHGYTGVAPREDIVLRVSATADGQELVEQARHFARRLRALQLGESA